MTNRFEKGKIYLVKSRCDRVYFEVTARTAKTATFKLIGRQEDANRFDPYKIEVAGNGETQKSVIRVEDNVEYGSVKVEVKTWNVDSEERVCIEAKDEVKIRVEAPEAEAAMTPEQAVAAKIVETLGNAELEFNFAEEKNNRTVKHFTCKANPAVSIVEVCFDDGAVDYIDINNGEKSLRYDFETDPFKKEIEINPEDYAINPEALDAAVEAETELAGAAVQKIARGAAQIAAEDAAQKTAETYNFDTTSATSTLDDLKKNSRLYAVSGKALAALAFGINAPIDSDDETAAKYEQAFQAVKTARDKLNESRKNFIKQYNQMEANIKARAKERLSKVSTQVLDMLQNIPTTAAIALKFMPSTPRNFTFDAERFGQDSYTAENKAVKIGEDTIEYDTAGKIEWVVSDKYGALLQFLPSGEIAYFTKPLKDDGKSFYNELDRWCADDFFLNLAERGACIIGDPKPTDDFASKLAELESKEAAARAAVEKAKVALLAAQNVSDEAEAEYRKARKEISRLLNTTASKLTEKIWELPLNAMTLNNQDGKSFKAQHGGAVTPHIENTFKISNGWKTCGYYETPAQVTRVIEMLAAALKADKTEFTFPTVDALNQANFTADSLKEVTV